MRKIAYAAVAVCVFSFLSPFVSAAEATKSDKTLKEGDRAAAQIPQTQAQAVSSQLRLNLPPQLKTLPQRTFRLT